MGLLCVNIMGSQDPLMNILISSRCGDIAGNCVELLPGLQYNKDIPGRARWDAFFNTIGDTGQKFRKLFHNLLDKITEIAYAVMGLTKFEGLEG